MRKNIKKLFISLCFCSLLISACTKADDFEVPPFTYPFFYEDFNNLKAGNSTNEVAVAINGTINTNTTNSSVWNVREFNNNKYMQFSSFYSKPNTTDNAWFILPGAPIAKNQSLALSFEIAQAFASGKFPLNIYYSIDFDGNVANINKANWISLSFNLPSRTPNYEFIKINDLSYLNATTNKQNVYIAFVYKGSKPEGNTTMIQIDNIKLVIN